MRHSSGHSSESSPDLEWIVVDATATNLDASLSSIPFSYSVFEYQSPQKSRTIRALCWLVNGLRQIRAPKCLKQMKRLRDGDLLRPGVFCHSSFFGAEVLVVVLVKEGVQIQHGTGTRFLPKPPHELCKLQIVLSRRRS